jgi:hypothetical protein
LLGLSLRIDLAITGFETMWGNQKKTSNELPYVGVQCYREHAATYQTAFQAVAPGHGKQDFMFQIINIAKTRCFGQKRVKLRQNINL